MVIRKFGCTGTGAVLSSARVATFAEIPATLPESGAPVVLFIAADSVTASATELSVVARAILEHDVRYLCCWGPGCERLHDIFDNAEVQRLLERAPERTLMTTWHADDSLPEALWFAVHAALPADWPAERRVLAVTVADSGWSALIDQQLLAGAPDPSEA